MKAYVCWLTFCNYQVEHGLIPTDRCVPIPDELIILDKEGITKTLCIFIMEIKNTNGDDYTCDTLYDLIVMLQSFFKDNKHAFKFFEYDNFSISRTL